jgi:hypothetical protein
VTITDKDKDLDLDLDKREGDKSPRSPRKSFQIPSIEELKSYCQQRNNSVNPDTFINHYSSNGWMVGKNKMKDWKAAVRTWEIRDNNQVGGMAEL